jgi:folate-dependent phosphoribosylglycinamide formyltransferase PurN
MRIGILTSAAAPGLDAIVAQPRDLFDISCSIICEKTHRDAVVVRPLKEVASYRNLRGREDYDRENADLLLSLKTDFLFLIGYPYVITEPLLAAFPERIIAVHDGDLNQHDESGARRWTGLHAVREAILAGETATRSSLYFVNEHVGHGALFLQSEPYPVAPLAHAAVAAGDYESVRRYASLHRAWMRRDWGTLVLQAVEHLNLGDVKIAGDTVWIDGVPGPCRHGDAPDICFQLGDSIQRGIPSSCPFVRQRG